MSDDNEIWHQDLIDVTQSISEALETLDEVTDVCKEGLALVQDGLKQLSIIKLIDNYPGDIELIDIKPIDSAPVDVKKELHMKTIQEAFDSGWRRDNQLSNYFGGGYSSRFTLYKETDHYLYEADVYGITGDPKMQFISGSITEKPKDLTPKRPESKGIWIDNDGIINYEYCYWQEGPAVIKDQWRTRNIKLRRPKEDTRFILVIAEYQNYSMIELVSREFMDHWELKETMGECSIQATMDLGEYNKGI